MWRIGHVDAPAGTAYEAPQLAAVRDIPKAHGQESHLLLLQTRRAQRTPLAALHIAVDMVAEGLITPTQALRRRDEIDLVSIDHTHFASPLPKPLVQAVVAGVGMASGPVAPDTTAAERLAAQGTPAILVRSKIITADTIGLARAAGLLTAAGSPTAHAVLVARQLGMVCLLGCKELDVDAAHRLCRVGGMCFVEGDATGLDGNSGAVYAGTLPVLTDRPERELASVAAWRHATADLAVARQRCSWCFLRAAAAPACMPVRAARECWQVWSECCSFPIRRSAANCCAMRHMLNPCYGAQSMTLNVIYLQPLVALIAGILILIMPRLLNIIVALYLILIGLAGLLPHVMR